MAFLFSLVEENYRQEFVLAWYTNEVEALRRLTKCLRFSLILPVDNSTFTYLEE